LKKAKIDNAKAYTDLTQADLDREKYLLKWQVGKLYFEEMKNRLLRLDKIGEQFHAEIKIAHHE